VTLGGPGGRNIRVEAGDALVLPAGTRHCDIWSIEHFLLDGAYPRVQDWDICREAPSAAARQRMAALPVPHCDPIEGNAGRLTEEWK
jgi:uncharacterized protein YjlB